jgi:plastocyanin
MNQARITESWRRVSSRSRVRALSFGAAIAAASALVADPMTAAPAVGRVEGVVRLVAPTDPPIVSGAYPSRRVSRPAARASEISNVIVFIKDAPRTLGLAATRARMMQQDEAFVPHVVAITRGSTVEFPNADPYFHNVFSLSRGAAFDLGRYPRGQSRSYPFNHAGLVKVYCHLHSHMTAAIMVFDHQHFTVPEADGSFALGDVPAGEWRLSAWHERIGESQKTILVQAGRTVRVEFALPVESE